jgi:hypothetical protein
MVHYTLLSQTGTIKIQKAKPQKDTIVATPKTRIVVIANAGINYTLKKNTKIGYNFGIDLGPGNRGPYSHLYSIGFEYCVEEQNYLLSAWDKEYMAPAGFVERSGTRSHYLKVPFKIGSHMMINRFSNLLLGLGLKPEYLLKTQNKDRRLSYSDLAQYNLSGLVSLGMYFKKVYRIEFSYSKDFFENLKDRNIYDSNGAVTGKQRSKTNLLSLTLSYGI